MPHRKKFPYLKVSLSLSPTAKISTLKPNSHHPILRKKNLNFVAPGGVNWFGDNRQQFVRILNNLSSTELATQLEDESIFLTCSVSGILDSGVVANSIYTVRRSKIWHGRVALLSHIKTPHSQWRSETLNVDFQKQYGKITYVRKFDVREWMYYSMPNFAFFGASLKYRLSCRIIYH